jgi:hypothetical protein
MPPSITVPPPDLQIGFAAALSRIRKEHLQDALLATIRDMEIPAIDAELARFVAPADLAILASHGLRGELLFAVPCILRKSPKLLTYYRLMLGYSQKEFYSAKHVGARFKRMEDSGDSSQIADDALVDLCRGFISAASLLLAAIEKADLSSSFLDDLTLLTLGAQLRGGLNVKKGADAIKQVFGLIHGLVAEFAINSSEWGIHVRNAAGRKVLIEFAPDPDIVIYEEMRPGELRNIIAIEVKGGKDFSNVHNRMGEAEKSHQKARQKGFVECWTVVNVDAIDMEMARRESPTTNRFYVLSKLEAKSGEQFSDFCNRIISLTGVPATS